MVLAIKLLTAILPVIMEIIKNHYPNNTEDEHLQIAQDTFNSILKK